MEKLIRQKLAEIEEKEKVLVLHAVESGSRAWGFSSPDSDYDVRFIYLRPQEFYLRLDRTRDVIEWQLDETLDINGWDLQKALRLLQNSNPTIFEWNDSPIVYHTTPFWASIRQELEGNFRMRSGLNHYLNTARSNYSQQFQGEMVRLKKYFYVIRPLLACKWILDRNSPPPVLFEELVETQLDPGLLPCVRELLAHKKNTPEMGVGPRVELLNRYIEQSFAEVQEKMDAMPKEPPNDWTRLNELFLTALNTQWQMSRT